MLKSMDPDKYVKNRIAYIQKSKLSNKQERINEIKKMFPKLKNKIK